MRVCIPLRATAKGFQSRICVCSILHMYLPSHSHWNSMALCIWDDGVHICGGFFIPVLRVCLTKSRRSYSRRRRRRRQQRTATRAHTTPSPVAAAQIQMTERNNLPNALIISTWSANGEESNDQRICSRMRVCMFMIMHGPSGGTRVLRCVCVCECVCARHILNENVRARGQSESLCI